MRKIDMNEFTIQELKHLSFAIYAYPHPDDNHIYDGLREKIKSMIEHYCEHEDSRVTHDYEVEKCNLCGILFV